MQSPRRNRYKQPSTQYFTDRENTHSTFSAHPSAINPAFFHHQHTMTPTNLNPLSLHQTRASLNYSPFHCQSYGEDMKTQANAFQPINVINGMSYESFSTPGADASYSSAPRQGTTEFDI
jgi:hypothetical protein